MKTRKKILITAFISAGFSLSAQSAAQASMLLGDAAHGKQLHDAKCTSCHISQFGGDGSGIYTRKDRRINTIEGLTGQVHTCNANIKAELSDDDVNDIIKYLNDAFYKFED